MFQKARWKRLALQSVIAGAILLPATFVSAETVTVKAGDTLGNIAYSYDRSVEQLKIANHLRSDMILAGSTLYIPPQSSIYQVQSGDTLWKIADKFNTTISSLKEINRLTSDTLIVGDKLLVPQSGTVHTVVSGDVLWKIASLYNVSIQSIMDANKMTSTHLNIGQKLIIPNTNTPEPFEPDKPWVEMTTYRVVKGDTPWSVSLAHGIPMDEFLKVNNLSSSTNLQIGQIVKIPIHHIPVTKTPGKQYGEYLDWFEAAQYLFPINAVAKVTDFQTGRSFMVKRTIGAFHSDTEPLTSADTAIIKEIWGGSYSWKVRPVIVEVNGRRIAASMSSMPHDIEYISGNNFTGHFDIHFRNSLRHKDKLPDTSHQSAIKIAAGLS
ncbi:LysM peptidoglycan-binding domain-containing protein [Brevibacillus sp. H7]|uniref:LysM peptidoglycan-binding domain-containing protein n=1 Tax=Brevibacillus sp. H7 TaxID=3349138 RepID=UPI00382B1E60